MLSSRPLKLAGILCAVLVAGCDRESDKPAQPRRSAAAAAAAGELKGTIDRTHKGEPLPAFVLKNPAGKTLDLASLKGKPALVNLWATWCAPCVAELPTLDRLADAREDELRVVTVSQDIQTGKVAEFLSDKGGTHLEPWLDPQTDLSFKYGAQTLPTTILYGADGKEIWRYVGGQNWAGEEAQKLLAEAGLD